jgi:hypothetical protein
MNAREIVDLAAFVAAQGPVLLSSRQPVPDSSLSQYWTASKCRLDRWNRMLHHVQTSGASFSLGELPAGSRNIHAVCEEILISEMLTRVWSSLLAAVDYNTGSGDAQPVAANVLASHLNASNRVLSIISNPPDQSPTSRTDLNRLRRLSERWTDLLLGSLGSLVRIADFAHDAARAEEFSQDFSRGQQPGLRKRAWNLLAASLRETFDQHLKTATPNADLNSRIGGAVLSCFPVQVFDSTGQYHSLWNLRISTLAAEAQMLVDELLAADSPVRQH